MAPTHISAEECQERMDNFMQQAVAADPSLADPDAMESYLRTVDPRYILGLPLPTAPRDTAKLRILGRYVPFGKPKTLEG